MGTTYNWACNSQFLHRENFEQAHVNNMESWAYKGSRHVQKLAHAAVKQKKKKKKTYTPVTDFRPSFPEQVDV